MIKQKGFWKKRWLYLFLTALALTHSEKASAKNIETYLKPKQSTQRTIELNITEHPFSTFDSRANLNYSGNQLAGAGLDYLGDRGLDENMAGRTALKGLEAYFAHLLGYVTHEAGHEGKDLEFTSEMRPGIPTPKVKSRDLSSMSDKKKKKYFRAGLNQNAYNASITLEKAILEGRAPGILYIWNSLYTAFYNPNEETRVKGKTMDDLDAYAALTGTSKSRIQERALIASIFTLQNWKSIYDEGRFLLTGEKPAPPLIFKFGENEITPPAIDFYLGEEGIFYNATSFINPNGEFPVSMSMGVEGDEVRIGGKIYNIPTEIDTLKVSPSAYVNIPDGGFSVGLDFERKLDPLRSLKLALRYSEQDLLEKIKGEKGFYAFLVYVRRL